MKKFYFLFMLAAVIMLATGCNNNELKNAKNWPVEKFTFTNHEGKPFGSKDLDGKVWVADFVFTNCADVCPPMTANMAKLQELVKEEKLKDVEFVSFSVDPSVDNPKALKEFGEKFHVDFNNWSFLTGYSQEEIEKFALKNFKALVKKPEEGDQVIHGTDFYLIDQEGKVVMYYSGFKEVPFENIIKDIQTIQ